MGTFGDLKIQNNAIENNLKTTFEHFEAFSRDYGKNWGLLLAANEFS
jgi:hypothetical protein